MTFAICGTCGTTETDPNDVYCVNHHDNWVYLQDVCDVPEHIIESADRLGITQSALLITLWVGTHGELITEYKTLSETGEPYRPNFTDPTEEDQ